MLGQLFLSNLNSFPKNSQRISKELPNNFQRNVKEFPDNSQRILKEFPKNSQDFENIQFPTSHLEAKNHLGLVYLGTYIVTFPMIPTMHMVSNDI